MVFLWYISSVSFVFLIGRLGNRNYSCSSWRMHFPSFAWYFQLEVRVKSKWVFWFQPWVPCWNSVKLGGFVVWHRPDGYLPSLSVTPPRRNIFLKTCATVTLVNMTKRHEWYTWWLICSCQQTCWHNMFWRMVLFVSCGQLLLLRPVKDFLTRMDARISAAVWEL